MASKSDLSQLFIYGSDPDDYLGGPEHKTLLCKLEFGGTKSSF